MKHKTILLFLMLCNVVTAQNNHYRFSIGGGFHSMMFWGLKDLKNVKSIHQTDFFQFYPEETYNVNYTNFQFAPMYNLKFNVKWYNDNSFEWEQSFSLFSGKFHDELETTLIEFNGVAINDAYYPDSTINLNSVTNGVKATHFTQDKIQGFATGIIVRKKLRNQYYFGLGMSYYQYYARDDRWRKANGYSVVPGLGRGTVSYFTRQLSLDAEMSYRFHFISVYLRLGQTFLTTKNSSKKGHWRWNENGNTKIPVSHNFDFRFPLTFETGITLSFDRIK